MIMLNLPPLPKPKAQLPVLSTTEAEEQGFVSVTTNIDWEREAPIVSSMERTMPRGREVVWIKTGAFTLQAAVKRRIARL